jgi:hypothetical protein
VTIARRAALALAGGLAGPGAPGTAGAHHPDSGATGPWLWIALLVAGVVLVAVWSGLALLERRRRARPDDGRALADSRLVD